MRLSFLLAFLLSFSQMQQPFRSFSLFRSYCSTSSTSSSRTRRSSGFGFFLAAAAMSTSSASATPTKKAGALIFLHGLGDTPAGWSSLERTLPQLQPRLADLHYVFPPAPTDQPITINGGARMPGWFDISDWPIGVGVRDDPVGKLAAVQQMERIVTELQEKHAIPRNRIVIGGFSQGGAIALLAAYYASEETPARPAFAGCAVLSGWLTLVKNKPPTQFVNCDTTPLFWAHGQYDDKVLFEQQAYGVSTLELAGLKNIEHAAYPMGHESDPDEIAAFATFLDTVLFSETEATKKQADSSSGGARSSDL